ncbi:hypothetical protein D3C80_1630180 [compost metagenome]
MTLIAAPVMTLFDATVVIVVTRLRCRQVAALIIATIIVTALLVTVVTGVMPRGDIHRVALHPIVAVRIIMTVITRVAVAVAIHRTTGQKQPQQGNKHGFMEHGDLREYDKRKASDCWPSGYPLGMLDNWPGAKVPG